MPNIQLITENLADELIHGIKKAQGIYIMTSFVMKSGVALLAPHLKEAAERGAEIKVLAGDYLYVTQPEGLRLLCNIDPSIEARLWHSQGVSFHPKAYLLDYEQGQGLLIVGSSNFSLSALKLGYEWNIAVNAKAEPVTFQDAMDKFMKLFYHENTEKLNEYNIQQYEQLYNQYKQRNPDLIRQITEMEEADLMLPTTQLQKEHQVSHKEQEPLQPRPAQEQALASLTTALEEGYDRAMVVMATGLGKTYLAAFFAERFQRVLFIAHREEILHQAQRSFTHVMPKRTSGLYNGAEKETATDFIFASIYTLGMKKHRERFKPDVFDLIVIDEFHHAAAASYQSVIQYFHPKFLLGITATPDRMDGKDVYALCDGNVAYRITFIEAIRHGWLSPFQYYGVYDETDYSQIRWTGNRYDEEELLKVQLRRETAERIYEAWRKHKQTRTLVFCSSTRQADWLAAFFSDRGHAAAALHSNSRDIGRGEAIQALTDGSLEVIFTVDLFNEGVDIPAVDTLLFVRPTESLTVFTQQIGRGLRLHDGKTHCTIIDLIGNYRNADVKLQVFMGEEEDPSGQKSRKLDMAAIPPGCTLELDVEVVNLLEELARKRQPRKEIVGSAYEKLKRELGRRPSYLEFHLQGGVDSRLVKQEFGSYVGFLHWMGELAGAEAETFSRYEGWLREAESTGMAKSYKMVLLLAMLERGPADWWKPITAAEAAEFFHGYYMEKEFRKRRDFSDKDTRRLWEYDEQRVANKIESMPMTKWSGSSKGLVRFEDGRFWVDLPEPKSEDEADMLYAWTRDVAAYRLHWYFFERLVKN